MRLQGSLCLLAGLVLACLAEPASGREGRARRVPWSGYWWPHFEGRMAGPLGKYDAFIGKTPGAADWEARSFPRNRVERWEGYCHAWAAAAILEQEPTRSLLTPLPSGRSLLLSVGDQKGLLTVAHYSDVANFYGRRWNGPGYDADDLSPEYLWRLLRLYVKQRGLPLILDLDCTREVWNYPVYAYRVDQSSLGNGQYAGRLTLYFADDLVPPDYVGTRVMTRTYTFTFRMKDGTIQAGSSRWTGASVRDHPDFAWYPYIVRPRNPRLDYTVVRRMLGLKPREPGEAQLPPPITDPAAPPQPATATASAPLPLPGMPANTPVRPLALSPTQLLTLLTHQDKKTSAFFSNAALDRFNGRYVPGENYFVRVTSNKAGYVYLFHLDREGNASLLFPRPGQDNRIRARKLTEFGGPRAGYKFTCAEPIGLQRIKVLITTRPLVLSGFDLSGAAQQYQQQDKQAAPRPRQDGQAQPLWVNSGLDRDLRRTIAVVRFDQKPPPGYDGPKKPVEVEAYTGTRPQQVLPEFSHTEADFYVGPAKKSTAVPRPLPVTPLPRGERGNREGARRPRR